MSRQQILAISMVLMTHAAQASPPSVIDFRLRQIVIKSCEAASFSNIVRVIPMNRPREFDVEAELGELLHAFMITAQVVKTRLISMPVDLPHQMEVIPLVESWVRPRNRVIVEFLYLSDSSCSDLMRRQKRFVVSTETSACDSFPLYGWCIVDSSRLVRDVPDSLRRYTKRKLRDEAKQR
jgi:hypothetical protein